MLCKRWNVSRRFCLCQENYKQLQHHRSFQPAMQFWIITIHKWQDRDRQELKGTRRTHIFQPHFKITKIVLIALLMPKGSHTLFKDDHQSWAVSTRRKSILNPLDTAVHSKRKVMVFMGVRQLPHPNKRFKCKELWIQFQATKAGFSTIEDEFIWPALCPLHSLFWGLVVIKSDKTNALEEVGKFFFPS